MSVFARFYVCLIIAVHYLQPKIRFRLFFTLKFFNFRLQFEIEFRIMSLTVLDTPLHDADQVESFYFKGKFTMNKRHQPSLSIDEQIENLKNLNLKFENIEYARKFLNDISYFRFIKAYSLGLKPRNGNYNPGVTFEQIVELYLLNANFRQQLFPLIERVEINLRTRIANFFSSKYGVLGYFDSANFPNKEYHATFIKNINKEINRNLQSSFIKNFCETYEDGNIPFYALTEIMSFGMLSKFYKNLAVLDKKEIAKSYHIPFNFFESWMECISYVRNLCAHYGRLYNTKLIKKPMLYNEYREQGVRNDRVFGILCCIKELVSPDNHWEEFIEQIDSFFIKYPHAEKFTMGFPNDWKNILSTKKGVAH